jgi:transmembrane sensor
VAAVLVFIGVAGFALSQISSQPKDRSYTTGIGERKIITLADGSRIELNTDSVLRLSAENDGRKAWLDKGEAYFQIRHDAAHPFNVVAGDHRVVDLGTRFVVRKEPSRIEVSLVEGSARVDTLSTWRPSQSALLAPGDVVVATTDSMSLRKRSGASLADELGWRRGLLVFRDATLAEAAAEFNRYNTHKIVIANNAAAHLIVGGTFPANDSAMFVRAAERLFKLHVETRGNETVIAR